MLEYIHQFKVKFGQLFSGADFERSYQNDLIPGENLNGVFVAILAQARLHQLQQDLYEKAVAQAASFGAFSSSSLSAYAKSFRDSIPSGEDYSEISYSEVFGRIAPAHIVLFGDFHTLDESQKIFHHLIESYLEAHPLRNIIIAVEMFRDSDQAFVDQFMAGQISEEELLKKTNYKKNWGFSWKNYRPILYLAKDLGLRLVGINSGSAKASLAERDKNAAKVLSKTRQDFPESQIFCLIGEFHLADAHLPKCLNRVDNSLVVTRVLNNLDHLSLKFQNHWDYSGARYYDLDAGWICVVSTSPWQKWRSLSSWEESQECLEASIPDLDYELVYLMKAVSEFLQLPIESSKLENFSVNLLPADFDHMSFNTLERHSLSQNSYCLAQDKQTLFLRDASLNTLSMASGELLLTLVNPHAVSNLFESSLLGRILKFAASAIASKILNPRHSVPSLFTILGPSSCGDMAASFIDGLRREELFAEDELILFERYDQSSNFAFSSQLGSALGHHAYQRTLKGAVPIESLRVFFGEDLNEQTTLLRKLSELFLQIPSLDSAV